MDRFWLMRLDRIKTALDGNGFIAHVAADGDAACQLVDNLIKETKPESMSWGGSTTVVTLGLYDRLKTRQDVRIIDTFDKAVPREEILERRRQALLTDLFITGCNAVTEDGMLVNLDMIGNRVAALTFGPRKVVVLVGRNKIVSGLEQAMERIKTIAAPANAMRLGKKTPCAVTGFCQDCKSRDRICNVWTITEKSYPKGRITVVLINKELGL